MMCNKRIRTIWRQKHNGHTDVKVQKSARNVLKMTVNTHLSITPPESPLRPLLGARESSSSKKTTQGAAERALQNTERNMETHSYF